MKSVTILVTTRFVLWATVTATLASGLTGRQLQPDQNRQRQIRSALAEHGYPSGKNWPETQAVLRGIATDYGWQTRYAPDARVLILLGLGNRDSNSVILTLPKSRLE